MSALNHTARRLGIDPRALLGLAVMVGGMIVWVLAFTGGINSFFSGSTTTVRADFASIEDIVKNDPVRVAGVEVGSMAGTSVDPGGRGGTVTINLNPDAPKIYRDAGAQIVWRTALGANDAIRLDPGTRAAGLLGATTIPQAHDTNQVELDQITQAAFRGGARSGLRTMIQQLAPALAVGRQTLNDDFNTLARIAPAADAGIGAVRGQVPDADLRNLVRDAGRAAQALDVGTNGSETRAFVQGAATTLSAVSASQAALQSSLQQLGVVIPHVTFTFPEVNHTLDLADPLIAKLLPQASRVGPTLTALHPAVANLDTLLRDATPLLRKLRPAVHSLADTASVGVPVIEAVSPSLQRLENKILPGLDARTPEQGGRPVYQELGGTVVQLGTLSHFFDSNGSLAGLTLGGNAFEPGSAQVLPCTTDFTGKDLLVCETLSEALATYSTVGTSFLQGLKSNPAMSGLSSWIGRALSASKQFDSTRGKVASLFPSLAKWLFHGVKR